MFPKSGCVKWEYTSAVMRRLMWPLADGRGRELAFRALTSLNDERPLPFMRQVVASDAEPAYRLRAIQYLTAQGDRQSLATLQVLMQSPTEQASIRAAAAHAFRALGGK